MEKKLYKILGEENVVVDNLSYEVGKTYELSDEEAAKFAEGKLEVVATPDSTPPADGGATAPAAPGGDTTPPAAPAEGGVQPAKEWVGGHTVGRD